MAQVSRNKRRTRGKETHKSQRTRDSASSVPTHADTQTDDDDGAGQSGDVEQETQDTSQRSPQPHAEAAQDTPMQQSSTSDDDRSHAGQDHAAPTLVPRNVRRTRVSKIRTGNVDNRRRAQEQPHRTASDTQPAPQEQPPRRNTTRRTQHLGTQGRRDEVPEPQSSGKSYNRRLRANRRRGDRGHGHDFDGRTQALKGSHLKFDDDGTATLVTHADEVGYGLLITSHQF